ncbi:MAG: transcription-repair coupling factor [Thalassobaculaceae bacterium]
MTKYTKISNTPLGWDANLVSEYVREYKHVLHICRDDARLDDIEQCLLFFSPGLNIVKIPAWDCLPYDRVSPNSDVISQRLDGLARLGELSENDSCLVLTTVNALLQRVPPKVFFKDTSKDLEVGIDYPSNELISFFENNGYLRTGTVREPGEYAVRGGIIDVFPSGLSEPIRLDFFGDELEGIRAFDPVSQRTVKKLTTAKLRPVAEVRLDTTGIESFRTGYRSNFGAHISNDPLYEAITEGRRHAGMEHWLPLFHGNLELITNHLAVKAISADFEINNLVQARLELIKDYFESRKSLHQHNTEDGGILYRPLPPDLLYINEKEWESLKNSVDFFEFSLFEIPDNSSQKKQVVLPSGGTAGLDLIEIRKNKDLNVYAHVVNSIKNTIHQNKRVILAGYSTGSRDRLSTLLSENGLDAIETVETFEQALALPMETVATAIVPIERGFSTDNILFLAEPDILGERLARPTRKRRRRGEEFLQEVSSLNEGDYVVHVEHGIGQFSGLESLEIGGAPHDCLRLFYSGGDKLFLPVENIDMLSRYGSEESKANLDKLGGVAWQARKARVKKRLRDMADQLIKVAAERELRKTQKITPPPGLYEEFCAKFKYNETDDQLRSIDDALSDFSRGRPMDRLVCGDVGFGKTEVALRAAMVVAMQGLQVVIVAPTTLLCRQHYQVFVERFRDLPIKIRQLSRLVSANDATTIKAELKTGDCNIVIGTHAVLGKSIEFNNIGLLIVDEEQHFGVSQKERLKELKSTVHVLTLTATPIPRTLQLAMSGVRDLSLIATPPVDRLTIRTFIMPYDGLVIKEAIQRERNRGGQIFYVCPRVEDLPRVYDRLLKLVPDAKIGSAHGRMAPAELEDIMTSFCDGAFDVLLSTNIVESGLDIPNANTIIIHRADMFGLSQLYQLRGRVGRSKIRAYAYLTSHPSKVLNPNAKRRLEVMQTLDSLGAGFSLASHDMDIRGAGNLLGEEQSGQVKEVGIELYQHLLKEAVTSARENGFSESEIEEYWTPQISIGTPVLIPENFIPDLTVRLNVYRRIADLVDNKEIDSYAAELTDRFGALPEEVNNLLKVIAIKQLCRSAGVDKVDAGPRGAIVSFRNDDVKNLSGLIELLGRKQETTQLRTDHKLVHKSNWKKAPDRVKGLTRLMQDLAAIAE